MACAWLAGTLSAQATEEPVCEVPVLRNGDFLTPAGEGIDGIPWWTSIGGGGEIVSGEEGVELLLRGESASVVQAIPAFAPYVRDVVLRGRVRGTADLHLYGGGMAAHEFQMDPRQSRDFEVVLREANKFDKLSPRLQLQLTGASDHGAPLFSYWSNLEVLAPLPCPSSDALRAEIEGHLVRYFGAVLGVSLDDIGPRATPFPTFDFDADSGARIEPAMSRAGDVSTHRILLSAWHASPRPEWEAALTEFLEAYLELCIHPETGLERRWDPGADRPLDDEPVQLHLGLAFLIDAAEHGPESMRARALAAAERMARGVLRYGVLPDGEVAASYTPSTGAPNFDVPHLRRLDVPAQLARLATRTADPALAAACLDAAEQACLTLAYDHFWPGDWANIDPGFDDNYGHYGARAAVMWEAHPDNAVFRKIVMTGWDRYAPLWRNALQHGGNIAADQVRCWRIGLRIAELLPERAPEIADLLEMAVHAHFQGEQIAGGAWIDITVKNFNPVALPVGDTGGVPQNLLEGLAIAYGADELGLATDAMRARFTAVLRTTVDEFGRAHGFAQRRGAAPGQAGGGFLPSKRVAVGLVDMLEGL